MTGSTGLKYDVKAHHGSQSQHTFSGTNTGTGRETEMAVNTLFTFLEDAYPFKFRSAFPSIEVSSRAKRIWRKALQDFTPDRIIKAGIKALKTTKFFPDLSDIQQLCYLDYTQLGLPKPLNAYYEACRTSTPTENHSWSHIAVYFAGKETGWWQLRSESQNVMFPVFKKNYEILMQKMLDGDDLSVILAKGLTFQKATSFLNHIEQTSLANKCKEMQHQGINPHQGEAALNKLRTLWNI